MSKSWRVLRWYERKCDRDEALDALSRRPNTLYDYRPLDDATKPAKKRRLAKVFYPEQ